MTSVDKSSFRRVMGNFATGVCLIGAIDEEGAATGLIVNSLTSVSLEPPIILWCLDKNSGRFGFYQKVQRFSVNILAADQMGLIRRFVHAETAIFKEGEFSLASNGAPLLNGAAASLECEAYEQHDAGDHIVIFARANPLRQDSHKGLLGFARGQFVGINGQV